ncbi:unnamed protein product [Urochloa humidicola]
MSTASSPCTLMNRMDWIESCINQIEQQANSHGDRWQRCLLRHLITKEDTQELFLSYCLCMFYNIQYHLALCNKQTGTSMCKGW